MDLPWKQFESPQITLASCKHDWVCIRCPERKRTFVHLSGHKSHLHSKRFRPTCANSTGCVAPLPELVAAKVIKAPSTLLPSCSRYVSWDAAQDFATFQGKLFDLPSPPKKKTNTKRNG